MSEMNRPVESVSTEAAEQLFASAARAMGGNRGRAVGYNRVSIPVSEEVRRKYYPEPEPDEPTTELDPVPAIETEDWFGRGATTVIPSAVVFDSYEEPYDEPYEEAYEEEPFEPTNADLEEEVAFSALAEALDRHAQVYGDIGSTRPRFHDYGFGRGISFDGPDFFEDEYEDEEEN